MAETGLSIPNARDRGRAAAVSEFARAVVDRIREIREKNFRRFVNLHRFEDRGMKRKDSPWFNSYMERVYPHGQ